MHRSPSTTALAALLAALALAAAAGALGSADLGDGPSVDSDEPAPSTGSERLDDGPTAVNQPSGSGDTGCGPPCSLPTARSLLGYLAVPLSPTLLAGGAALAGLLLLAARNGAAADGQPTDAPEVVSADGIGTRADATATGPEYDTPEEDTVVAAFRRLRAAAVGNDGPAGDDATIDSLTPRDVRRAAVDAGYDPEAVTTVVRAFEAVRYGDGVTAARERAVEDALTTLDPEVAAR